LNISGTRGHAPFEEKNLIPRHRLSITNPWSAV
jgi:hypothetical protein